VIFNEVALLASCVERMGILLVANQDEDERDTAAYQQAIKAISSQIGLISDIGSELCGGSTWYGADPRRWLLPPMFHQDGSSGQAGAKS
jgi:hypothetical protein